LQKSNFDSYKPNSKHFVKVLADFQVYGFSEQFIFPFLLKKYQLDLVHFTHFNAPILYRSQFIVTIHDLIISHYPNSRATTKNIVIYKIKLFFYKLIINIIANKAQKIITVSEYSKKDIVQLLKIKESKVIVTYEGVDLPSLGQIKCDQIKKDLGINRDFLLYVGSAYPHKNLEKLIEAFGQVLLVNNTLQLVLVGSKNYFYSQLANEVKKADLDESVILTDYLSDSDLACLYREARLYIFPSLIEGFGLPPLEAQSYGLPVLSSFNSCLPEILGDSVLYFNPNNASELARLIIEVLGNQQTMDDLRNRGYNNLKQYSWHQCALKTIEQYQM